MDNNIRLSQYSVIQDMVIIYTCCLNVIYKTELTPQLDSTLLMGNSSRNEATVYDLANGTQCLYKF